jgi:hypothetical protein
VVKALYDYNAPRDDDAANSDLNLKVNDVLEVLDESVKFQLVFPYWLEPVVKVV